MCHADVVSCVHPVAVLNAAFCMTCSLLMLVEDGRGILQSRSHDVVCDELHDCTWNPYCISFLMSVCMFIVPV